jgi:hypothetical protein
MPTKRIPSEVAPLLNYQQRAMVVVMFALNAVGPDAMSVVTVDDTGEGLTLARADLAQYLVDTDAECRAIFEHTVLELAAGRLPPWLSLEPMGES